MPTPEMLEADGWERVHFHPNYRKSWLMKRGDDRMGRKARAASPGRTYWAALLLFIEILRGCSEEELTDLLLFIEPWVKRKTEPNTP